MSTVAIGLFRSLLDDSLKRLRLEISLPVQSYIGELFFLYIKSDHIFEINQKSGRRTLKTFAETYFKANQSSLQTRNYLLKQIADRSLYLGGFFRESLNQKSINLDYYLDIGQSAYEGLAESHPLSDIYQELSDRFIDLTDVMSYIATKATIKSNKDLLKLYNQYLSTGSKVVACQLEDHGVCIPDQTWK